MSRIGGAASWICQFAPLAVVTVFTAAAGAAATSVIAPVTASALKVRCKSSLSYRMDPPSILASASGPLYGPPVTKV